METKKEIDHSCTDEVVCPYCGYQFMDSWEFGDKHQDVDCPECGKKFHLTVDVSVTYSTDADCEINEEEHDWVDGDHQLASTFVQKCSKCDNMNFLPKPGEELELKFDNGSSIKVCGSDKIDEARRLKSTSSPGFPHF